VDGRKDCQLPVLILAMPSKTTAVCCFAQYLLPLSDFRDLNNLWKTISR
jgi:hypothetical protein